LQSSLTLQGCVAQEFGAVVVIVVVVVVIVVVVLVADGGVAGVEGGCVIVVVVVGGDGQLQPSGYSVLIHIAYVIGGE